VWRKYQSSECLACEQETGQYCTVWRKYQFSECLACEQETGQYCTVWRKYQSSECLAREWKNARRNLLKCDEKLGSNGKHENEWL